MFLEASSNSFEPRPDAYLLARGLPGEAGHEDFEDRSAAFLHNLLLSTHDNPLRQKGPFVVKALHQVHRGHGFHQLVL